MPAVSRKQKRFMCAEYGRIKAGKPTSSGIKASDAKDFCTSKVRPKKRAVKKGRW